jgi:hypothetical protein
MFTDYYLFTFSPTPHFTFNLLRLDRSRLTMVPDRVKLLLLSVVTGLSLGSIITSPSITMNNPNMRVLAAPVRQFCKAPREAAKGCNSGSDKQTECNILTNSVRTCDQVLQQAFHNINLRGCPFEIKAVTLCEDEWCRQDPKSCFKECSGVRESLSSCIQGHVVSYFQRSGLTNDGILV